MLICVKKVEHCNLRKIFFLKIYIKIEKTIMKFGYIEIQKQKFHQHEGPISIKNADIDNKIVVLNKVPFGIKGFKYFTGYKDAKKIKSLHIFLPKNDCI